MNIRSRLSELEKKFGTSEPIVLQMPDGSTRTIRSYHGDELMNLLGRAMREQQAGVFSEDVDIIRRSIGGTEKGGHMVEVVRALLNSPKTNDSISERSE